MLKRITAIVLLSWANLAYAISDSLPESFLPYEQLYHVMVQGRVNLILADGTSPNLIEFDNRMVDYFVDEMKKKFSGKDIQSPELNEIREKMRELHKELLELRKEHQKEMKKS